MSHEPHTKHFERLDGKPRPPLPPSIPVNGFDLGTAWWMLQCASVAYQNPQDIVDKMHDQTTGFDQVTFFDTAGTQGFLAHHPNNGDPFAVLVFRGTDEDYYDILTDISIIHRKLPEDGNCKVHSGFWEALQTVWTSHPHATHPSIKVCCAWGMSIPEAINTLPKTASNTLPPLYITGHSMGGALATLAASEIVKMGLAEVAGLYTFGMPKVGNKDFANRLNQQFDHKIFRLINWLDVGPRFPMLSSFYHSNGRVFLHKRCKASDFKVIPNHPRGHVDVRFWIRLIWDSIWYAIFWLPARIITPGRERPWHEPRAFVDHRVIEYVRKVEQHLP